MHYLIQLDQVEVLQVEQVEVEQVEVEQVEDHLQVVDLAHHTVGLFTVIQYVSM